MPIVVDAARDAADTKNLANETYQSGNDNANTPSPTWDIGVTITQSAAETHVNFAYETGTDNTADAAVPIIDMSSFFLDSTPATTRF